MGRVLWVLLMLGGVALFGVVATALWFMILSGRILGLLPIGVAVLSLMATGACAAAMFMSPREVKEATKEPELPRPAWLDELKGSSSSAAARDDKD